MRRGRNAIKKSEHGFTLLEVLIAISIFAIGILGVASMQISSIRTNSSANKTTESSTYAQDKLEAFASLAYTDASIQDTNPTVGSVTTYTETSGEYTIQWTVDDNNPVSNVKRIALTVTWDEKGLTRRTQLVYLKMDVI